MPNRRRFAVVVTSLLTLFAVAAAILWPSGAAPAAAQGAEPEVACFEIAADWLICEAPTPATVQTSGPCATGTAVPDAANNPGLVADCTALLEAKDTLRGTGALNWSADLVITAWEGVTVSGTPSRVSALDLAGRWGPWLMGTIPPALGELSQLRELDLRQNQLSGPIPSALGDLAQVRKLNLQRNQLSGPIPPALGGLAHLKSLSLSYNRLTGAIRAQLGNLAALERLYASSNRLSGAIPPELGKLASLESLSLSRNQLTGAIPPELGDLGQLRILELTQNLLTGQIPPRLGDPPHLAELRLAWNRFTGCLPRELTQVRRNDLDQLSLDPCPVPSAADAPSPGPEAAALSAPAQAIAVPLLDAPVPEPWQPAIREIPTDHAALGRVQHPRSETIDVTLDEAAGLFFLDVATGAIEGWIGPSRPFASPSNRYVYLHSATRPVLYDRWAERTFTWDPADIALVFQSTGGLLNWGTGSGERLVFQQGLRYAVVDASMDAVAWFSLDRKVLRGTPRGWWAHPEGTHLLLRSVVRFGNEDPLALVLYAIDLSDGSVTTVELPLPGRIDPYPSVHITAATITVIAIDRARRTCTITRYDWRLSRLSHSAVCCDRPWGDLSPDGTLFAVPTVFITPRDIEPSSYPILSVTSIFDTSTGAELLRVKGALRLEGLFYVHFGRNRWLADSSGLVLDTRDGPRILHPDGTWRGGDGGLPALLIPSRDDPDRLDAPPYPLDGRLPLYLHPCDGADDSDVGEGQCRVLSARVVDGDGAELASARLRLNIPPGTAWDIPPYRIGSQAFSRTSWGRTSDELRIHLVLGGPYEGVQFTPALPAAIERPPFTPRTALTIAANDTCWPLREAPDEGADHRACLSADTVVSLVEAPPDYIYDDDYPIPLGQILGFWVRVRTEEGVEGWMHVDGLRWAPE